MDSRKKMVIALSSLAVIILAGVVAIAAVLAAQNITIKSAVNVSYTANEIAGTVTAKYKVAGGSEQNIGSITYDGTEEGEPTTDMDVITIDNLTKNKKSIEFIFTFTNTGSSDYTATLTLPETVSNFTPSFSVPTGAGITKISDTSFTIAGNTAEVVTYSVTMTISDVSQDAKIEGSFAWNLG